MRGFGKMRKDFSSFYRWRGGGVLTLVCPQQKEIEEFVMLSKIGDTTLITIQFWPRAQH
jgi:hypothetical protein